jgi:hypothetical protein
MAAFDPTHVEAGFPGTLYAAPLGTTEPTAVSGAWPAGWVELGYTDTGSEFDITPTVQAVEVEEEYWPVDQKITLYSGKVSFALAETTQQNFVIAMNGGLTTDLATGVEGTNADGSLWQELPDIGLEKRIMLGWDALPKGATGPNSIAIGRFIFRKCLQAGTFKRIARKGNVKATYAVEFMLIKPTGLQPMRQLLPASLAS